MSEEFVLCECAKDGEEYACVCACGARMRSRVKNVFHICNNQITALNAKATAQPPTYGPGTELKKLLKKIGITATPNCSCNARARTMDANGCDWCEANIDTIVGWLKEEATKRKLPFIDLAGKLLVKRAIRNARKKANSQ